MYFIFCFFFVALPLISLNTHNSLNNHKLLKNKIFKTLLKSFNNLYDKLNVQRINDRRRTKSLTCADMKYLVTPNISQSVTVMSRLRFSYKMKWFATSNRYEKFCKLPFSSRHKSAFFFWTCVILKLNKSMWFFSLLSNDIWRDFSHLSHCLSLIHYIVDDEIYFISMFYVYRYLCNIN